MSYIHVAYEVADRIALLTLNRPDRLNAWTQIMEREARDVLTAAGNDDNVSVILVTGAGRGFCAGADMEELKMAAASAGGIREFMRFPITAASGLRANYDHRFSYMLEIPKPIVCAINGPIVGIGLCMALFADLRFIAEGAKVTTAFAERGLIAEHGIAWILPRLIGPMNAFSLLYATRPIDATEADRIGLARKLAKENFLDDVRQICAGIATAASPRSLRIIKRQIYDGLFQSLSESAMFGDEEMFASFASEDFREGIAHYLEKRPPRFTGR